MKNKSWIIMILIMLLLVGCVPRQVETNTIRIALLPVLDTLPLYVAESEGLFNEQGVTVELVPVSSAPERDQLMQAGQVDAMLNEVVSTLFYNQNGSQIMIVRFARTATPEYPIFRILASAESGITSVEEMKGIPVGISDGTVIAYTTDRILEKVGLTPDEIATISVPKIPDRMALLASGELQAANLPDPVASLAIMNGASLVADDTLYPEISHSVISFSSGYLQNNPATVKAFLAAYEQAVNAINQDKSHWTELLLEQGLLPQPLAATYVLPDYPLASVPSLAQFEDAQDWAQAKGLLENRLVYQDSVTGDYLP